ncbi:ground-like domain protein [Dictyocaulus viviparus]|uniref:Ground-like domain protein n=1 Tax=Dictyocaulus viviparus TaxID=29172 RepID=A0A0D8Y0I2_DICVI|nr:ground-like domain protein [Dictyocaulus viviparus]
MFTLLIFIPTAQALFFGSSGCGCSPPPVCPPAPVCGCASSGCASPSYASASYPQPQYPSQYPQQFPPQYPPVQLPPSVYDVGPPRAGEYTGPSQKVVNVAEKTAELSSNGVDSYLSQTPGSRVRRDIEAAFDPKCNSEILKEIILKNIDKSTAVSKRKIQEAATADIGGRIDVICSTSTFSYIVNTELYCETESNGITCFAFRQSS